VLHEPVPETVDKLQVDPLNIPPATFATHVTWPPGTYEAPVPVSVTVAVRTIEFPIVTEEDFGEITVELER